MGTIQSIAKQRNQCTDINIEVYKQVDTTKNKWEDWVNGALTVAGALNPVASIVSFGITTLIDSLKGHPTANLDALFQTRVNEAFTKLSACVDQKIINTWATEQRSELKQIAGDFSDIKTKFNWETQKKEIAAEFRDVFDDIHDEIGTNFAPTTDINRYVQYLPVFEATALLYERIFMAYLSYLKYTKQNDNFKTYYLKATEDAATLSKWIGQAHLTIYSSLSLNPTTKTLTIHSLDSIAYETRELDLFGVSTKVAWRMWWGTPMVVQLLDDSTNTQKYNYQFIFTANSGATDSCTWPSFHCPLAKSSCAFCDGQIYQEYFLPSTACRGSIKNHAQLVLNQYDALMTQWSQKFTSKYYSYTTSINYRMAEILAAEGELLK
eukprot:470511_1